MSLAPSLAADGSRPVSFLPSIKCSNCGDEIEISAMETHVCGTTESMLQQQHQQHHQTHQQHPPRHHLANAFAYRQFNAAAGLQLHQPTAPSPLGQSSYGPQGRARAPTLPSMQQHTAPARTSPKPALPRINANVGNTPFFGLHSQSPASPAPSNRSAGMTALPPLQRGMTVPMPRLWDPRPPSPELSANLDCAFPPFPTSTSSSTTPTSAGSAGRPGTSHGVVSPSNTSVNDRTPSRGGNRQESRLGYPEPVGKDPLKSPKANPSESLLKRMNTLRSGPFDGKPRPAGHDQQQDTQYPVRKTSYNDPVSASAATTAPAAVREQQHRQEQQQRPQQQPLWQSPPGADALGQHRQYAPPVVVVEDEGNVNGKHFFTPQWPVSPVETDFAPSPPQRPVRPDETDVGSLPLMEKSPPQRPLRPDERNFGPSPPQRPVRPDETKFGSMSLMERSPPQRPLRPDERELGSSPPQRPIRPDETDFGSMSLMGRSPPQRPIRPDETGLGSSMMEQSPLQRPFSPYETDSGSPSSFASLSAMDKSPPQRPVRPDETGFGPSLRMEQVRPQRPVRPDEADTALPTFTRGFSAEPVPVSPSLPSPLEPTTPEPNMGMEDSSAPRSNSAGNEGRYPERSRRPSETAPSFVNDGKGAIAQSPHARIEPHETHPSRPFQNSARTEERPDRKLGATPPIPRAVQEHRQDSVYAYSDSGSSTTSSFGNSHSSGGPSPASSAASSIDVFSPLQQDMHQLGEDSLRHSGGNRGNKMSPGMRAATPVARSPPKNYARPIQPRPAHSVFNELPRQHNATLSRPMNPPTFPPVQSNARIQPQPAYRAFSPTPTTPIASQPARPVVQRTPTAPNLTGAPGVMARTQPPPPSQNEYGEFHPYRPDPPFHQQRPRGGSDATQFSRPFSPPNSQMFPSQISPTPTPPPLPVSTPTPPPPSMSPETTPVQGFTTRNGTAGKTLCRGCGYIIEGKSVKAADGRLTGRWHKGCFTCRTCHEPFATADFYVIDNHPYCEQHYHENNGSLCHGCHRGIEGQYLESFISGMDRKFHPRCFTCVECRQVLSEDYFDVGGRPYCELHAMAMMRRQARPAGAVYAQGPLSNLNPNAGWRAERRTTRMMMM